ncbi:uncharacterized protein PV06_01422 [Exophiala oligosperma]|uniref:FAD-binding domain-containing protein n=3 Tax=Chaetothyriales TaxID=34395 RepID=A0A0D2B9H3_9EURO|nr:uncharacterized protein PV06_01422 [Exophiala oligosperma]KIW48861.1 hypothetical protein PV06_01422 [Exophiala oligosperma]
MTKIIIIGGGISGLSSYLFLHKHLLSSPSHANYDIRIYDSYDITASIISGLHNGTSEPTTDVEQDSSKKSSISPTTIGGAIGISKNGLNVLSRLGDTESSIHNPLTQTISRGHPIQSWDINTARGFKLASIKTTGSDTKHEDNDGDITTVSSSDTSTMVMIARQVFVEILYDQFKHVAPTMDILQHKRVVDVVVGDEVTPNIVKFEDGSQEEADLVIGADGLRSVLRKAIFESHKPVNCQDHEGSGWARSWVEWLSSFGKVKRQDENKVKCDYVTPHYEGLVGVGGFVPSSILKSTGHKPESMSIVFGPNGFFGYGYLTSATNKSDKNAAHGIQEGPLAGWWSTFSSNDPYPFHTTAEDTQGRHDVNDGDQSNRSNRIFDPTLALKSLVSRQSTWKNKSVVAIVKYIQNSYEGHSSRLKSGTSSSRDESDGTRVDTDPSSSSSSSNFGLLQTSFPTYTTPELPHWHVGGRVVLIGDAAHALQPSSGQGASQALEDSETLALVLEHFMSSSSSSTTTTTTQPTNTNSTASSYCSKAIEKALVMFETVRKPRVHAIYEYSQRMSRMKTDMGFVMEWIMYFMIWVTSFLNQSQSYNDELLEYDLPKVVRESIESGLT